MTTRTSLVLIVHIRDLGRASNTVRLLSLAVRDATVLCHGAFPAPADPAAHVPAGATPVVLFPGHGARPLTPELVAALPSAPALVVPDGNWRQASRMVKRLPLLAGAVKVALPDRAFAGMAVRRNQVGHHMSTYEAVAQALGILEGEEVAGPLFEFYRRATDRMLLVRGKLQLGDVYGGLDGAVSANGSSRATEPTSRIADKQGDKQDGDKQVGEGGAKEEPAGTPDFKALGGLR
jgi:DTW domain-containing protein YfiP